uniref:Uncharacterized protein n=1 Tax=Cucumis sativus TaxID=3659 RepID=A0A0A0KSX2_CUCSA
MQQNRKEKKFQEATLVDSFLADLDELSDEDKFRVCNGVLLIHVNEVIILLVVCE